MGVFDDLQYWVVWVKAAILVFPFFLRYRVESECAINLQHCGVVVLHFLGPLL